MSEPQQNPAQPYGSAAPQQPAAQPGPPYGVAPQAGQHPTAPAYAASPQHPASAPYPPAAIGAPSATGNPLGRVAFLVAVVSVGVGLLSTLVAPFLFRTGSYDVADSLMTVLNILVLLGGIAALVLGIIALRRTEPRLLAAIAVGLAGAAVVGRLFVWLTTLMWSFGA